MISPMQASQRLRYEIAGIRETAAERYRRLGLDDLPTWSPMGLLELSSLSCNKIHYFLAQFSLDTFALSSMQLF